METTKSQQFLRKRKFLLVLPILVIPFVTLAFLTIGGGSTKSETQVEPMGLNPQLPEARNSGETLDKMSLYNQAEKDSSGLMAQTGRAFFDRGDSLKTGVFGIPGGLGNERYPQTYSSGAYTDPNEARVQAKLAELERIMSQPPNPTESTAPQPGQSGSADNHLARMETLMQSLSRGDTEDPEIRQLNAMLEKIMEIQNPDLAREKLKVLSGKNKGRIYGLSQYQKQNTVELLKAGFLKEKGPAFYDLSEANTSRDTVPEAAIPAVVHETQTLVTGQSIRLRLTAPVYLNGQLLPAESFVSGICSLDGERLNITISSIRHNNSIYQVSLTAYGMDGLEGLKVQDAISRDAANTGSDRALQSLQLMSMDPSLISQAAGAGFETVKGIFSKKARLIKVSIKAGLPLLLLDMKARQESN